MSKVRVLSFGVSLDGFGAGPHQDLKNPLGVGGMAIMQWFMGTQSWNALQGNPGGATGVDDEFAKRGFAHIGSWILGRNMFGPIRGEWPDDQWKGWWGDTPPYHVPVFVLTHYPRPSIEMKGGTTFHFVTEGIHEALKRAQAAAQDKDVRIGGGVNTVRQYLQAKLIDEIHLAVSPKLLGTGEHLLHGINLPELGYTCTEYKTTPNAAHFVLTRS